MFGILEKMNSTVVYVKANSFTSVNTQVAVDSNILHYLVILVNHPYETDGNHFQVASTIREHCRDITLNSSIYLLNPFYDPCIKAAT